MKKEGSNMSLFEQWKELAYQDRDQEAYDAFWGEYLPKEQVIYQAILGDTSKLVTGTVAELAKQYDMDQRTFVGFMDGINTSLKEAVDLDTYEETTKVTLDVDHTKLFYNMLDAKADWLYGLPEWDEILTIEQRKEIKKAYNKTKIVVKDAKIGRNDPCPCGSGKKYKKCCINK